MGYSEITATMLYEEYKEQKEKRGLDITFEEFVDLYEGWKESSYNSFDGYLDYVLKNFKS